MRLEFVTSLLCFGAYMAFGQSAAPPPAFDVASVKVSAAAAEGPGHGRPDVITPSPGGVTMMNVRLKAVVQWAYHLQAVQVTGPGWLDSSRFDIIAKASGPPS